MLNLLKISRTLYRKIFKRDLYNVGLLHDPIHCFLDANWRAEINWLPEQSRAGSFIADPFGIEVNGKQDLLCEYFDYSEPMGRIVGAEIKDSLVVDVFEDVIVSPCHTSYPFLFAHEGQVFCIPETSRAKELALYKMEVLPSKWRKEKVLLNIDAVDPSIIYYVGRWWLFYGLGSADDAKLFVSYSDSLYGPWFPHAKQPVKTDSSSSRPGGTPFIYMGKLYRPAQDGSNGYGRRIVINEIVTLSPEEFEEHVVSVVEPDKNSPYPDGLHTLSALGNMTLVDSKREKFIMAAVVRSVKTFLRRVTKTQRATDL